MRIIDADALKAEFDKNCAMECACCDNATCNHARNAVGCGLVDAAPTIDAIPMWWITEKFLDVLNKDKELSKAVWLIYKAWQKEQEAR